MTEHKPVAPYPWQIAGAETSHISLVLNQNMARAYLHSDSFRK